MRDFLLWLCDQLGILVNHSKSTLLPSQRLDYLSMTLQSTPLRAFPTQARVHKALSFVAEFQSSRLQPLALWLSLLGVMSSLLTVVPGSACGHSNTTCWLRVPISGTTSWFPGTIPASRIFGGGPSLPTSKSEFLWTFPTRISYCTPMPRTQVGVRLSDPPIFWACGLRLAASLRSTTANFWRSSWLWMDSVSSFVIAPWLCSRTTPLR